MFTLAKLHRRVRRLLPAGLATAGVLAPADPQCWASSPLSRLALDRKLSGVLALRLDAGFAGDLQRRGIVLLQVLAGAGQAAGRRYRHWQPLPRRSSSFWTQDEAGELAVLLDGAAATAWLLWQDTTVPRRRT